MDRIEKLTEKEALVSSIHTGSNTDNEFKNYSEHISGQIGKDNGIVKVLNKRLDNYFDFPIYDDPKIWNNAAIIEELHRVLASKEVEIQNNGEVIKTKYYDEYARYCTKYNFAKHPFCIKYDDIPKDLALQIGNLSAFDIGYVLKQAVTLLMKDVLNDYSYQRYLKHIKGDLKVMLIP